jgi:hypothetical protein
MSIKTLSNSPPVLFSFTEIPDNSESEFSSSVEQLVKATKRTREKSEDFNADKFIIWGFE